VPAFISLKNCLESAETISVRNSFARRMARSVLPAAVGPATTIKVLMIENYLIA
jgi:hypothetical protein